MDAKYDCHINQNSNDRHDYKTKCTLKIEPAQNNKDQTVQTAGQPERNINLYATVDRNTKRLSENVTKIRQELEQGATDGLELKQEPVDEENKAIEELFADHEVKEEMVLGPVVLVQSTPLQTSLIQESPKSKIYHDRHVLKKNTTCTILELPKKIKNQAHICKICNKEYKYETGLVKHMASHVTMGGVTVKIRRQDNRSKNITHYKKSRSVDDATVASQDSITHNHDKSRKYVCDICQKVFETENDIVTHMNVNHRSIKGNYFCDICYKSFGLRRSLRQHKQLHSNKYFKCDICQKAFKQKHSMSRHKALHKNVCFTCDICQKAFRQKSYLVKHMNIHSHNHSLSGRGNYFCEICNQYFKYRRNFNKHKISSLQ